MVASLYAREGTWIDNAFGLKRQGHGAIKRHFEIWINSVPDSNMQILRYWPTENGAVIKHRLSGTMTGELNEHTPASGGPFEFVGTTEFVVDQEGKLELSSECYRKDFWNGKSEKHYHSISDL